MDNDTGNRRKSQKTKPKEMTEMSANRGNIQKKAIIKKHRKSIVSPQSATSVTSGELDNTFSSTPENTCNGKEAAKVVVTDDIEMSESKSYTQSTTQSIVESFNNTPIAELEETEIALSGDIVTYRTNEQNATVSIDADKISASKSDDMPLDKSPHQPTQEKFSPKRVKSSVIALTSVVALASSATLYSSQPESIHSPSPQNYSFNTDFNSSLFSSRHNVSNLSHDSPRVSVGAFPVHENDTSAMTLVEVFSDKKPEQHGILRPDTNSLLEKYIAESQVAAEFSAVHSETKKITSARAKIVQQAEDPELSAGLTDSSASEVLNMDQEQGMELNKLSQAPTESVSIGPKKNVTILTSTASKALVISNSMWDFVKTVTGASKNVTYTSTNVTGASTNVTGASNNESDVSMSVTNASSEAERRDKIEKTLQDQVRIKEQLDEQLHDSIVKKSNKSSDVSPTPLLKRAIDYSYSFVPTTVKDYFVVDAKKPVAIPVKPLTADDVAAPVFSLKEGEPPSPVRVKRPLNGAAISPDDIFSPTRKKIFKRAMKIGLSHGEEIQDADTVAGYD